MISLTHTSAHWNGRQQSRRGSISVMSALCLTLMLALTAFAVDIGYIAMTKAQLQNATDAAALAGGLELLGGLGPGGSANQASANARAAAASVAQSNEAVNAPVYVSENDIVFGNREWFQDGTRKDTWGTAPYNLIRLTSRLDSANSTHNDKPLKLFFAPVIGTKTASLHTSATVVLASAGGFTVSAGSTATADVLPIAYDLPSWNAFLAASTGADNYRYDPSSKTVSAGSDGVREFDLYPYGNQALTPGNRGTVDIGSSNNSTADLKRQIVYGLNANDLSYFPDNTIRIDNGSLNLNGDTGISAGIEASLISIIGQTRAIPIFSAISGPGNNANYTIVKFVGVRIMYVKLNGSKKKVVVQPAPHFDSTAVATKTGGTATDYIYVYPRLTQ